ncbi:MULTISPECIES: nuclear transport factor 2 family protein [unclassified Herbaspirillum]|uniref:nuclear transport factor 2 family protein n=1 Tax=unclassified Herbaspirillum TaxID=2624150 RepID=UPI000E2F12E1|nr:MULTISPECIES: nuclear transport factor 2 family protein [unclassified Herbaspirillum]RFB73058.1 nuclear transport factor 2 family protein [Herbaspirillum sp. 3R-3a1]TFI11131.1 nuclear transport factor 2 family protein [Herbaspirillum sp. 3R11]TFI17039.1 nuclear transport factor 2 family protein [Herbaspirillum sp. 3R-11]TFI31117.1 nuclear transport factor 2 family protein [Herbaspirillum sp. 3C11]
MFRKWMYLASAMVCSMVIAQGAAAAPSADEQAVATAVEKLRVAMTSQIDRGALDALTEEQLSYGHSNGVVQTKAEFIGQLVSGESTFVKIDLTAQTVNVQENVAVVRHTLTAATNDSGKPGNVSLKILMVWKKTGGQWRLLARQAVRFAAPT